MNNDQHIIKRNVMLLQGHAVFLNMIFILPVLVPYYRDQLGLGFREFMIGEAVFAATVLLMEVPSGWLSDVWTRRKVMIIGTAFNIIGFSVLGFAQSFAMTIVAQSLIGISVSLISGTNSALLYDSLLALGQENKFRRAEGLRQGLNLYMVSLSCIIGGFAYQMHPLLPLVLSVAASVVALGFTVFMVEPPRHKESGHKHPVADMIDTMRYALHGHAEIAGIILLSAALFASTKMLMWTQQPYYGLLHLPEGLFGVFMALGFLLGGLGAHFGHCLEKRVQAVPLLLGCMAYVFGACLLAGLWPGYHAVPLLLGGSIIWGLAAPIVQDALNKRIPSTRRATILSTASLMVNLIAIPLYIVIGHMSDAHNIQAGPLTLAALMGGAMASTFVFKKSVTGRDQS